MATKDEQETTEMEEATKAVTDDLTELTQRITQHIQEMTANPKPSFWLKHSGHSDDGQ